MVIYDHDRFRGNEPPRSIHTKPAEFTLRTTKAMSPTFRPRNPASKALSKRARFYREIP